MPCNNLEHFGGNKFNLCAWHTGDGIFYRLLMAVKMCTQENKNCKAKKNKEKRKTSLNEKRRERLRRKSLKLNEN